ncbi:MAG: 23S rRNA (adenine(2503)-C(2))-methyltransferase RlmN [Bdellovibrionales bacterium]|nr:23S rRNA (adenine(2503)-C(2))-methyltransferase RlmN [Bdellovibrionales bacterium]
MEKTKHNFYNLTLSELESVVAEYGHKAFRARQLFQWIYAHKVTDLDKMTNLSKDFKQDIPNIFNFEMPDLLTEKVSTDGTRKYLFSVGPGLSFETVMIPAGDRNTLCVSSEVGCNMACKFCFTAKQKLKKRLTASEIVGQFIKVQNMLPKDIQLTNIVFMGMGEPLDNPEGVFSSIKILTSELGVNLSRKKITVSTSGLVDKIPLVTESGARLAVSLNGADNQTRDRVMPINKKWNIEALLQACLDYTNATKDKVTFEYVLLKDVTDRPEDAKKLIQLARKIPCKINIIPFNEHPNSGFERPSESSIDRFQKVLMNNNIHVLRRKTMGRDIYAACGQLNSVYKNNESTQTRAN